jgi:hypothetical protein
MQHPEQAPLADYLLLRAPGLMSDLRQMSNTEILLFCSPPEFIKFSLPAG